MVKTLQITHDVLQVTIEVAVVDPTNSKPARYQKIRAEIIAKGQVLIVNGVEKQVVAIGSSPTLQKTNDLYINDVSRTVSAKHGIFMVREGSFWYFDNNSINGAVINGTKFQLTKGKPAPGYRIEPGKLTVIEIGRWNPKAKGKYYPAVRIRCGLSDHIVKPTVVQVGELVATYQTPEGGVLTKTYVMEILSNDYIRMRHVKDIGEDVFDPVPQVLVGRDVSKSNIVVPQFEGTTMRLSKEHGAFSVKNGFVFYQDLKSKNGSFLNNTSLAPNAKHVIPQGYTKIGLGLPLGKKYPGMLEINLHAPKKEATVIALHKAA
jgi:pSer/pThr/pTyr-binding forkhead associated (FHA) protein